ncbi:hypothetical protein PRIPAC_92108 [Pristionchus pacificus]|uniref:Uncharacterized protein n=1 Tax=Pristionchus pacificus TaxID=54126 RepID=A0A2A6CD32_PRIPA|nr:hypothetical protein PRIPAC_92108 [Pristionchus pacificus]|eukprot:PDM76027.1 hypothetical protein PRIPAC_39631 [Pristionchus pacificus]
MTIITFRRGKTESKEVKVLVEDDDDVEERPEVNTDTPMPKRETMVATFIVFILIFAILALVYHLFYAAPISAHPLNFENEQLSPIDGTSMAVVRTSEGFANLKKGQFIVVSEHEVPYLEGLWNRLHDIHIGWPALGASLITIWTAWHFRPIKVRDVSLTIEEALRYKVGIRGDYIEIDPEGEAATTLTRSTKVIRCNGLRISTYPSEIVFLILNSGQEGVTFTVKA